MRNRTIIIAGIIGAGTVLALWAVTRFVWLENVVRLESHAVGQNALHAADSLDAELAELSIDARALASSDAVLCVLGEQATPDGPRGTGAEHLGSGSPGLVAVLDPEGRRRYLSYRDARTLAPSLLPAGMASHLGPERPLVKGALTRQGVRGLVTAEGSPYLVTSMPVTTSGGTQRVGVLVVGRQVGAPRGASVSLRSRSITLLAPQTLMHSEDGLSLLRALRERPSVVRALGTERIEGYAVVNDLYGQPAVVLKVGHPRTMYQEGLAGTRYFVVSLVLVIAAFGLAALWALERVVVDRVERLMADVDAVQSSGDPSVRVRVDGKDELASLGKAVNRMLGTLGQAQAELVASETRFRDVALNMSDWVWETDAAGRHTYVSDRISQVLGHYPPECIGQPISWLAAPDCAQDLDVAVAGAMADHAAIRNQEIWASAKDGRRVYIQLSGVPVFGAHGQLRGYRGVGKDITEQARVEETQRLAAVGQLAAGVAHEFNNVLASMRMAAELSSMSGSTAEYETLTQLVLRGTVRGAKICSNLLRFGRPEEPKREAVSIEAPIEAALTMAVREVENAGVRVVRDYASGGHAVHADRNQLEQVFLNLIINACHAMPDGGELRVSTRHIAAEGDGVVEALLSDTGCGISPTDLGRVFEPFFTTKAASTDGQTRGSGLGLSVSHGIIKAHGGHISVESELGVGTTLCISLRTCACRPAASPEDSLTPQGTGSAPGAACRRVLVVDDEDDLRECLGVALETAGYEVVRAASGEEAAALLLLGGMDLVITDVMMPGRGVGAVLEATGQSARAVPVLVMTGRADDHVITQYGRLATAFLWKPFTVGELLQKVRDALVPVEDLASRCEVA